MLKNTKRVMGLLVALGVGVCLTSAVAQQPPASPSGCHWYAVPVYCGASTVTCMNGEGECEGRIEAIKNFDYFGCGGPALPTTSCDTNNDIPDEICLQFYGCMVSAGACVVNLNDAQGLPMKRALKKTVYNKPGCE